MRDFECWTCLDFGDLADLGPCPDCRPDAYTEHVLEQLATPAVMTKGSGDV